MFVGVCCVCVVFCCRCFSLCSSCVCVGVCVRVGVCEVFLFE